MNPPPSSDKDDDIYPGRVPTWASGGGSESFKTTSDTTQENMNPDSLRDPDPHDYLYA